MRLKVLFEQPDSVSTLLPAFDKLVGAAALFHFTPKTWHAAHVFLFSGDNIMQGDETSFANKFRIGGKIGSHSLVAMVAVDEKKIEGPAAKELPYLVESLSSLGIRA